MNINTPFKCYWKGDSGTVYTVSDKTDMYFSCTWFDDFGREEFVDYSKSSLLKQIENGGVIVVGSEQQDPQVTIPELEYHSLIEEVNMLQELVAELSSPQDTAQEQQAETYRALQMLLVAHPSFQDGAGENTTHLEELCDTVKVLQAAYDRLSSTPKKNVTDEFKPISEYTLADWEQACKEDWVFECRNGSEVRIMETYTNGDYVLRGDDDLTRNINGFWCSGETDGDDIVKRIK